jgi:signal transduction histidine kinase/ActR/RegA family two-component response regulator
MSRKKTPVLTFLVGLFLAFGTSYHTSTGWDLCRDNQTKILTASLENGLFKGMSSLKKAMQLNSFDLLESWRIVDKLGDTVYEYVPSEESFSTEGKRYVSYDVKIEAHKDLWGEGEHVTENLTVQLVYKNTHFVYQFWMILIPLLYTLFYGFCYYFWTGDLARIKKKRQSLSDMLDKATVSIQQKDDFIHQQSVIINDQRVSRELFVADLCHEIKTPLNSLYSMIYSVADQEKLDHFSKRIQRNQTLVMSFLDDFIELAKTDSGVYCVNKVEQDLIALADEAIEIVSGKNSGGRKVVFTHSHTEMIASVDSLRVKQIIINLMSNALKYGGYCTHLDISIDEQASNSVIITVRDFGSGIPRDKRETIFNAFDRGLESEQSEYEGIGLGLHIVSNICRAYGAKVQVGDAYPRGTFFKVSIPAELKKVASPLECGELPAVAFVGETFPAALIVQQALSGLAQVDTYFDVESFLSHLKCNKIEYSKVVIEECNDLLVDELVLGGIEVSSIVSLYKRGKINCDIESDCECLYLSPDVVRRLIGNLSSVTTEVRRILVLDDNWGNIKPIRQLGKDEYAVFAVDNINDALMAVRSVTFDAIFVDNQLFAGESGFDFISRCRIFGLNRNAKIFAYTASSVRSLIDINLLAGADSVLPKPLSNSLSVSQLISSPLSAELVTLDSGLPDELAGISGQALSEDGEIWFKQLELYMSRDDSKNRTVLDELFSYLIDLDGDEYLEPISDYLLDRFSKYNNKEGEKFVKLRNT